MKRTVIFLLMLQSVLWLYSQPYQLPNGGFESWDGNSEPSFWNAFPTAACDLSGVASIGCGTATATRHERSSDVRPGTSGSSCKIFATEVSLLGNKIIANGTITTGQIRIGSTTPTSPENYNITRTGNSQFRQKIDARPDSIIFWAKFTCPDQLQTARMSCVLHDNYDYKDPAPINDHCIATAEKNFKRGNQNWTRYAVPFTYRRDDIPKYILLSFTTNSVQGAGSKNDFLYIDDVELFYNTSLSDLTVDGQQISGFHPEILDYHIDVACNSTPEIAAVPFSDNANVSYRQSSDTMIVAVQSGDKQTNYNILVRYVDETIVERQVCQGDDFDEIIAGEHVQLGVQNQAGQFDYEVVDEPEGNCHHITTLQLTVHPTYNISETQTIPTTDFPYSYADSLLSEAGDYVFQLQTQHGCDSSVNLHLIGSDHYESTISKTICKGEPVGDDILQNFPDAANWPAGYYDDSITFRASIGCDSIIKLDLTIHETYNDTLIDTVIVGNGYLSKGVGCDTCISFPPFKDICYIDSVFQFKTMHGCDSLVHLMLTVIPEPVIYDTDNELNIKVFPNPADEWLTVKADEPTSNEVKYYIYDAYGRTALGGKLHFTDLETTIYIGMLVDGIYIIRFLYADKNEILKFAVE